MDSMIERVARAIVKRHFYDAEPEAYNSLESFFADLDPEHLDDARDMASAAIEAMRTPNAAMERAVAAQWGRRTWSQYNDVIDAALKETT